MLVNVGVPGIPPGTVTLKCCTFCALAIKAPAKTITAVSNRVGASLSRKVLMLLIVFVTSKPDFSVDSMAPNAVIVLE